MNKAFQINFNILLDKCMVRLKIFDYFSFLLAQTHRCLWNICCLREYCITTLGNADNS